MLNGVSPKSRPLASVAPFLRSGDVTIVNLEIPLTKATTATTRKSAEAVRAKMQFILKADPAHIGSLVGSGVDAVSLGNNHAMDYQTAGLTQMTDLLRRKRILWAGVGMNRLQAEAAAHVELPGVPMIRLLSLLAFRGGYRTAVCTPAGKATPGVAALSAPNMDAAGKRRVKALVASSKRSGEMLVVALHGGIERETMPNAYQVALARAFVDAGADVVLGHHPHVLQGGEVYRGRPILYSLGNLVSSRPGSTALFRLWFRGGEFKKLEALPCQIAGGKTKPLPPKTAPAGVKAWNAQSKAIARTYASKRVKPLTAAAWPSSKESTATARAKQP